MPQPTVPTSSTRHDGQPTTATTRMNDERPLDGPHAGADMGGRCTSPPLSPRQTSLTSTPTTLNLLLGDQTADLQRRPSLAESTCTAPDSSLSLVDRAKWKCRMRGPQALSYLERPAERLPRPTLYSCAVSPKLPTRRLLPRSGHLPAASQQRLCVFENGDGGNSRGPPIL